MEKAFEFGTVVTTPRIRWKMKDDPSFLDFVKMSLGKYAKKNWGDTSPEDWMLNDESMTKGEGRIFATFKRHGTEDSIWIITEADHSVTTVLFPDEY